MTNERKPVGRSRSDCRWSEPILKRRYATAGGDSDSSITSSLESITSPRPPSAAAKNLQHFPRSTPHPLSLGCSCHQRCQEAMRRRRSSLLSSSQASPAQGPEWLHEKLMMRICECEGDDIDNTAQHNVLKNSLYKAKSALAFVAHYTKCLDLQYCSNQKLCHLISDFISDPSDRLANLLNAGMQEENHESESDVPVSILKEVACNVAVEMGKCDRMAQLQESYTVKRNNFLLASRNFCHLLENSKLTNGQLKKLENQYSDIVQDCRESRVALEEEMVKVIDRHKETMSLCFTSLSKYQERLGKSCNDAMVLFSCLSEELKPPVSENSYADGIVQTDMPSDINVPSPCENTGPATTACACLLRQEIQESNSKTTQ